MHTNVLMAQSSENYSSANRASPKLHTNKSDPITGSGGCDTIEVLPKKNGHKHYKRSEQYNRTRAHRAPTLDGRS